MTTCARCGVDQAAPAGYCADCGARLTSGATADADPPVRKYVAVLFVDLVGSTAVAERTDPEVLRGILARYFAAVSEAVWRHGGTVEKYIGDAVMAVFGAPVSHGDDVHRAVRAAIAALAAVDRLSAEVDAELGIGLEARAGVNGGVVYLSRQPDGQLAITGDAVHVAQRLESTAPPGGVLIGASAGATVGDVWELESLGAVHHRGRSAASEAYLVRAARRPDPRRRPILGRDRELRTLRRLREECGRRRRSGAVTLVADAGAGKSRLLAELAAQGPAVTVTCRPDRTATFGLVADLVDQLPADWRERLRAARPQSWEQVAARLRPDPDATTSVGDVVEAARVMIGVLAEPDPVLLVWDDVHAATEHQLDLIARLVEAVADEAVLTVMATRPPLFARQPRWGGGRRSRVVDLEPLPDLAVAALVRSQPAAAAAPDLAEEVVRRARGNPSLALALARWPTSAGSPPTAQLFVAAVVEQLEQSARAACEAAAQLHDGFTAAEVAAALGSTEAEALVALARLQTHDILAPSASPPSDGSARGARRFDFASGLLQETVREMVPSRRRAEIHLRLARHLAETGADAERVLHHHECARRMPLGLPAGSAEAERAAADVRQRWIGELAAVGDPRLIEELVVQAETLAADDDRILLILLHALIAPDFGSTRECLGAVVRCCAATPWWDGVRSAVEGLLDLRREAVSPADLLPAADPPARAAGDAARRVGARLVHLLLLGQVFAGASCFGSCRDVAAAGIALAGEIDDRATGRLFRGLELQTAFIAPDDLAATARLAEQHLAAVAGSARETAKTQAILTATYACLGDVDAAARAWAHVDTPVASLDPEELVVARQYHALRLEVAESSAAAAAEWRDLASRTTHAHLSRLFRASASECFLRAGQLDQARRMRSPTDADDEPAFALLDAVEAARVGDVAVMARTLDLLHDLDGVRAPTLDAALATVGRAMAHVVAGDDTTAARLLQQATGSLRAVGARALLPVADAALASARRLRPATRPDRAAPHGGPTSR